MPIAFIAAALLGLQLAFVVLPSTAVVAAHASMAAAPLLAALACAVRARRERAPARGAWAAMAASVACMAAATALNGWHEQVLGERLAMYRDASMAFSLATVPVAWLLASEWTTAPRRLAFGVDALTALALGLAVFAVTWSVLTAPSLPDGERVRTMVLLFDAQNAFLALGALARWRAAGDRDERDCYGALSVYTVAYAAIVCVNNRVFALDAEHGAQWASSVNVAFALLAVAALATPDRRAPSAPDPRFARAVRAASPLLVAGALLLFSLFLVRHAYEQGVAGVMVAVLGFVVRATSNQVRQIAVGEALQQQRSELQSIAWTDALTGLSNRRFLEHAIDRAARREVPLGQRMAVAMIDVDHFKRFNDTLGHAAGDACLRAVAQALATALARPGDVLARYGGEEFVVLLHDADLAGARVVGERLRAAVEALDLGHPANRGGIVTVSVGVASGSPGEGGGAGLLEASDRALYRAKRDGRNRVASATG